MKCSARRKCQHCKEFYLPDRRNLHHQRYCAEPACRRQSKAESQCYYSDTDKTAARLLSLNEAQLREARRSLLAAGLIVYESPLYQVLSLEPTSTSEQPVARTGQTLPISAILRQMLETGGAQQQPSP